MAAIIQLRRGSSPSSLSYGEPFINDDSASLVVGLSGSGDIITLTKLEQKNYGNLWLDGDITASNISASGDIRIGGQLFLGDEASDNIVIQGSLSSSLIPESGSTYDLGSTTKKWKDLHVGTIFATSTVISGQANISGSAQITAFGFISGSDLNSLNSYTSSTDTRIDGIDTVTASFDSRLDQIETATSSYLNTNGDGVLSGSQQVIDSLPTGVVSGSSQTIANLPTGVVSGSDQLTSVFLEINGDGVISQSAQVNIGSVNGFSTFSSSVDVSITNINSTTSSFDGRLDEIESTTSSFETRFGEIESATSSYLNTNGDDVVSGSVLRPNEDGVLSGSEQITAFGFISESDDTSRLNLFTQSFDTAITLNSTDVTILGNLTVQGTETSLNTSTLQVEDKNILVASGAADSAAANGAGLTIDGANKSLQWNHTEQEFRFDADVSASAFYGDGSNLTGVSADSVTFANVTSKPAGLVSGSAQTIANLPTGVVSGSSQIDDLGFLKVEGDDVVSGSVLRPDGDGVISGSVLRPNGDDVVSGSGQITISSTDGFTTFSSSLDSRLGYLETESGSLDGRLDRIELETGSINTSLGELNTTTESFDGRLDRIELETSSIDTSLGEINTFTSSADGRLNRIELETSSFDDRLDQLETHTGSLGTAAFYNVTGSIFGDSTVVPTAAAVNSAIAGAGGGDITAVAAGTGLSGGGVTGDVTLNLDTGSTHFTEGVQAAAGSSVDISHLNTFTGSADGRLDRIELETSSFDSRLDQIETATSSFLSSGGDGVISQSAQVTNIGNSQLTNSAITISGTSVSLGSSITDEVLFGGTGTLSGSQQIVDILNTNTVISGSSQVNANTILNFDANVLDKINAEGLISESAQVNANTITNFDANVLTKLNAEGVISQSAQVTGIGNSQLTNSSITISGTSVSLGNSITDEVLFGGTGVISGSEQVDATDVTNFDSNVKTKLDAEAVLSGSSHSGNQTFNDNVTISGDLSVAGTTTYTSTNNVNIGDNILELNFGGSATEGGILVKDGTGSSTTSGSFKWDATNDYWKAGKLGSEAEVITTGNIVSNLPTGVVSGSSQLTFYTDSDNTDHLNSLGVISGSSQVTITESQISDLDKYNNTDNLNYLNSLGVFSGSSQVNANTITNFDANVLTKLNAEGVFSSSAQVDGASITNKSVSFGGVSVNLGSSDATPAFNLSDATSYPGDSSLTTLGTVTSGNVTAILPTGVISGSSQETFESSSFAETASLAIHTAEWILGASGTNHYTFTGPGHLTGSSDPAIYLTRGQQYRFTNESGGHPFRIQSTPNGSAGTQYNNGVTNQDAGNNTTLTFDVPMNAPNILYYQCTAHGNMGGPIYIADAADYLSDTLATVTGRGATTSTAVEFSNTTNSTSKTTGAVIIGGGLGVNNTINAGGDVIAYASSDERLKDNIQTIENPLEKLSQISGNTFDWNEEKQDIYKGRDYGVIAQEIEQVMPELVDTRDNGYKAVKYEKLVPLLIESIKELQKEIEELKSK